MPPCLVCSPLGCTNYTIQIRVRSFSNRSAPGPALPASLLGDDSLPSNPCFTPTSTSTALNFLAEPSRHRPLKAPQNFPPPLHLSHILSWHLMMASLPWRSDWCSVFYPLRLCLSGTCLQDCFSSPPSLPGERPICFLSETFLHSHSDCLLSSSEAAWPLSSALSFGTLHILLWALLAASLGTCTVAQRR